jgi:hypothetical protein
VCHCCDEIAPVPLPLGFRNDDVVLLGGIADIHRQEPPARQRLSPAFKRQNQSPEGGFGVL